MSVTKEDLREQNEKLAKVIRKLDQENAKLLDQAKANLEKKAVEAAKNLAGSAQTVANSATTAKKAADLAETTVEDAKSVVSFAEFNAAVLGLALVSTWGYLVTSFDFPMWWPAAGAWSVYLVSWLWRMRA